MVYSNPRTSSFVFGGVVNPLLQRLVSSVSFVPVLVGLLELPSFAVGSMFSIPSLKLYQPEFPKKSLLNLAAFDHFAFDSDGAE